MVASEDVNKWEESFREQSEGKSQNERKIRINWKDILKAKGSEQREEKGKAKRRWNS